VDSCYRGTGYREDFRTIGRDMSKPATLGELRRSGYKPLSVTDEIRQNLVQKLKGKERLFPGVLGYQDTVVPQVVNALLARQNFILLGLRGQAKTRLLRTLTTLLDPEIPALRFTETNDDPFAPISPLGKQIVREQGDSAEIVWLERSARDVEKLATPDVTIADLIGDLDPIKAAKGGKQLSDDLSIHYGLLPRANRGIFAINELPDLAGKIQVGLFNIMQEGDVQIKGFPVRLPLDVLLVFSANPEDYTARGKIITPLKDRIGAEIRTHYPASVKQGVEITKQEVLEERAKSAAALEVHVPELIWEVAENIAFQARIDKRIDKRSGVSQRLPISLVESVISNAERRALACGEEVGGARIGDIYASLPAITGKLELEYEGEQFGSERIAIELIRKACARVFTERFAQVELKPIVDVFSSGRNLTIPEMTPTSELLVQLRSIRNLVDSAHMGNLEDDRDETVIAACELILEGLYAQKKIHRSEARDGAVFSQATQEERRGRSQAMSEISSKFN